VVIVHLVFFLLFFVTFFVVKTAAKGLQKLNFKILLILVIVFLTRTNFFN
jgi:hypothetical protein